MCECLIELIDVGFGVRCVDREAEVGGGWAVGVLHEREDDVFVEESMLDAEHVGFVSECEGEDWCWVVVCLDAMGAEHGAGVVDVVEELRVDAWLGLEEVEGGARGGGECGRGGGGADVCGGVVA